MSKLYRFILLFFVALFCLRDTKASQEKPLIVYVHETLYIAHKELLEQLVDFPIVLKPFSGGDLKARVMLEKEAPIGDVVWGLDAEVAFSLEIKHTVKVPEEIRRQLDLPFYWDTNSIIATSYAYLTFLYDEALDVSTETLEEFLRSLPDKSLAVPDPRTSMLGRGVLSWLSSENYPLLHKKVRTYPKGWSGAFALFDKKKVSGMFGYTTSVLYHQKQGQENIKALILSKEAHPLQIMTAFVLKKEKVHPKVFAFLSLLLRDEVQKGVIKNYSYPVTALPIPEAYKDLKPRRSLVLKHFDPARLKAWMRAGYQP